MSYSEGKMINQKKVHGIYETFMKCYWVYLYVFIFFTEVGKKKYIILFHIIVLKLKYI